MKKIYYTPEKVEVKLGDFVTINNVIIEVTDILIKNNPSIFEVKDKVIEYLKLVKTICVSIPLELGNIYKVIDIYKLRFTLEVPNKDNISVPLKGNCWEFKPTTKNEYLLQEAKNKIHLIF